MDEYKQLVPKLAELRRRKGKNQASLATALGYSEASSISHIETGQKGVSAPVLLRWLSSLGVDLNDVIDDVNSGLDLSLIHEALNKGINVNKLLEGEMNSDE